MTISCGSEIEELKKILNPPYSWFDLEIKQNSFYLGTVNTQRMEIKILNLDKIRTSKIVRRIKKTI